MEALELVLFLLAAVIASSILERFLPRLSLPLVQIALGALIALLVASPFEQGIDTELLLILFIAPLHFNESRHADSGALWRNRWGIASLAVGLVFAIMVAVGGTLHALMPAVPLAAALALGAAMGSTDAVAVTALSKDFRFGRRHAALLEGEAFFNDVTGTVAFQCAVAVVASGAFSLVHAGEEFALDLFGGLVGGAVMGALAWALLELIRDRGLDNPTLHVTLELLLPFVIYLAAKSLHIGGVIAVVSAGLVMSLLPQRPSAARARLKLQSRSVWATIEFVLNGVIFVILGMQLPRGLQPAAGGGLGEPLAAVGAVVLLTAVLEGVRFAWVLGMDVVAARREGRPARSCLTAEGLRGALAMAFAGPKGGITLSLMLTIPVYLSSGELFPERATLVSLAAGVILGSLLLANFAVPLLVPRKEAARRSTERVDAEVGLVIRVIESVQADAHLTGSVQGAAAGGERPAPRPCVPDGGGEPAPGGEGAAAALASDGEAGAIATEVDEPATVIVMRRYADVLEELAPHADPEAAARARATAAAVGALYERIDDIAREAAELQAGEDDEPADERPGLTDRLRALRAVNEAVDDVQAQALVRELEFIKELRAAGAISPEHARELRNDVYIQQLAMD